MLTFFVPGTPQTQGSHRTFRTKAGRTLVVHDNPKLGWWRETIRLAAHAEMARAGVELIADGPVSIRLTFALARPKSLQKRVTEPATRPDLDKLTRACLDALTSVAWRDDGQVTELSARKIYGTPGVTVALSALQM